MTGPWLAYYIWVIRRDYAKIENLAKEKYSTSHLPQNVSKRNPSEQREFRDIIDYKREAFRHILAAAWFEYRYSLLPTRALGIAKEKVDLLKQKIKLYGSGRTDSGVHALGQSAHFDVKNKIEKIDKLIKSLNFFLNKKMISIINIKKKI